MAQSLREYAKQVVGQDTVIDTPYGHFPLIYADWTGSGRLYLPIEHKILDDFGPLVANTHTESNTCGEAMTHAYHEAKHIIKTHTGANNQDVLLAAGSGMTSAIVLFQRLLGWRFPEQFQAKIKLAESERPVVFVSEMEHHSNQTTWIETIADVVVVPSSKTEPINLQAFKKLLHEYHNRKIKVAAITAASNVTGVRPLVHDVAALIHHAHGLCFVDYSCAAPYDKINMHPADPLQKLDAIYFSPHKFLGGPGTPGILIFDRKLYHNAIPDRPGGGTVAWTNPWNGRSYFDDIEVREDGGTPPFLGLIKAALAVRLKENIGLDTITEREAEIVAQVFSELDNADGISLLDKDRTERLSVFSFTIQNVHYNLVTRLLNDRFGIQARGGCACAGTYGHCLLNISPDKSKRITDKIDRGDLSAKLGFTRVSFHPVMDNRTITYVTSAIKEIARYGSKWAEDYSYDSSSNEFTHRINKDKSTVSIGDLSLEEAFDL